jgi:hypothetical protein
MNFIAALILMAVDDECLAFYIFTQVLDKDKWRNLYLVETPKLFEMTDKLREFIRKDVSILDSKLKKFDLYLESLFASAFMTLFSNLVSIDVAFRVLDRFILGKKLFLKNLIV